MSKGPRGVDVSRSIVAGAEVARLRIDVEVLQRDLQVSRLQLAKLRAGKHLEQQRELAAQRAAISEERRLEMAETQRQSCIEELARAVAETQALQEDVRILEEEVANHVVGRAHLGAAIERRHNREHELQQLVEALEAECRNRESAVRTVRPGPHERFSLDVDDSGGSADSGSNMDLTATELEYLGKLDGASALPGTWTIRANYQSGSGRPWEQGAGDVSEYEAPLRALEVALSRLRNSMAENSSANDDLVLEPGSGGSKHNVGEEHNISIPAGTGEAADSFSSYDRHLSSLQQALIHLGSSGETQDSRVPYPLEEAHESKHLPPTPVGLQLLSPYVYLGQRLQRTGFG